jgi:hypothetical protein
MKGYCPDNYSSSYADNTCFFYYSNSSNSLWDYYYSYLSTEAIACLIFIVIIILIVIACITKKRQRANGSGTSDVGAIGSANHLNQNGQANSVGNNIAPHELNYNKM